MKRPISLLTAILVFTLFPGNFTLATDTDDTDGREAETSFQLDRAHSSVTFRVRHLGISTVSGTFGAFDASISLDPADVTTLDVSATIDAASVNTGIERRDNHLRSPDFFAVEEHSSISFESTEVRRVEGNSFQLVGDLTIRGVTKPVVLDAEMRGPVSAMGKNIVAFTASGSLNRFDYGLTWNRMVEAGGVVVGEDVQIEIEVEAATEESAQAQ